MKAKHLLSYACDKRCSYCINELLEHDERQTKDAARISHAYYELAQAGVTHMMLSGGEPVVNKAFEKCLYLANVHFETVSVITAHRSALSDDRIDDLADDVLYSIHTEYLADFDELHVDVNVPVYCSMVYEAFLELEHRTDGTCLDELERKGFAGATIRELYPDGLRIDRSTLRPPAGFSLRIHDRPNCASEDLLLLPDLSLQRQYRFVGDRASPAAEASTAVGPR